MLFWLKFLGDIWSRYSKLDKGVLGQLLRIIVACRLRSYTILPGQVHQLFSCVLVL